jgi:NAD(P)-dependent dehydrogenase (short-subunit alcohol dehydrogenase family)
MNNLSGKVAVITGAGSGIGRALAIELDAAGCILALSDINQGALDQTAKMLGHKDLHSYNRLDVSNWGQWQEYGRGLSDYHDHIDLMINNAGVALGAFSIEEVSIPDFEWLMGINFWGMVYGTKTFLPILKQSQEACLVNISSILGIAGLDRQGAYCSSKFGIRGFTEALRMEAMANFPHVNILCVHPGGIQTDIAKNAKWENSGLTEEERHEANKKIEQTFINTPSYAAKTIIQAIRKKKKRLLIGKDAKWMYQLTKWFPVAYTSILYKQLIKRYQLDELSASKIS